MHAQAHVSFPKISALVSNQCAICTSCAHIYRKCEEGDILPIPQGIYLIRPCTLPRSLTEPLNQGSYFDSTLIALSAWPPAQGLATLSIVQDRFTPEADTTHRFAQPIVFFRLDLSISALIHSPAAYTSLTSLRLRIPARDIVRPLTVAYTNTNPNTPPETQAPPRPPHIAVLDVSTSNVTENDIERLLVQFGSLEHLILDGCTGLLRGASAQALGEDLDWWTALGRLCALAGVKKARDREKELQAWYAARAPAMLEGPSASEPRRPRRGRRGLATATISLRGSSSPPRAAPPVPAGSSTGTRSVPPKTHIVPPLPTLRTLALFPAPTATTPTAVPPDARMRIRAAFERGWSDGLRVLWEKRARMGATFVRGPVEGLRRARFLQFREGQAQDAGFEGLEDVGPETQDVFFRGGGGETAEQGSAPVLCLAGSGDEADGHASGCGHGVARNIWKDRL